MTTVFSIDEINANPLGCDFEATIEIREKKTGKQIYFRHASFPDVFEACVANALEAWRRADDAWIDAVERSKIKEEDEKRTSQGDIDAMRQEEYERLGVDHEEGGMLL